MTITIKNDLLTATIAEKGAELVSLKDVKTQTEHVWQADPAVWGRHTPILFPIVGKLKNNEYTYEDKTYTMHQHGFARDLVFTVINHDDKHATFELRESAETKMMYPFDFILQVTFQIVDANLKISYHVENPADQSDLYFSIGAHPGFRVPLTDDTKFEDYYLHFDPLKSRVQIPFSAAGIDLAHRTLAPTDVDLALNHNLFDHDVLIYEVKGKNTFSIKSEKTDYRVSLAVDKADYIGVWSPYPTKGEFVCIEPWWGIADDENSNGQFTEKTGIRHLTAGQSFDAAYELNINVNHHNK